MIAAPVAELQFIGFGAVGQSDNLMAQADTENRVFPSQLLNQLNDAAYILRIARSIGEEYTIRCKCFHIPGSRVPGQNGDIAAPVVQAAHNIAFHTAVNGRNPVFCFSGRGKPGFRSADLRNLIR